MKLMNHMIIVDVDDEKKLLINSLNGLIDQVSVTACEVIEKWKGLEEITPEGELEEALYESLLSRGYLVKNQEEEQAKRDEVVKVLREKHMEWQSNPKRAVFVMTYNCNFRCSYCFEGESVLRKEIITTEQIDAALELIGDGLESIILFGGEPLLPENRASLQHLISKTADKTFGMYTNGYHLLDFFDILSKLKFDSLIVTLDGDEHTHNSRRFLADGSPTFDRIVLGIEKFLENGTPIIVRINVDTSNLEESNSLRNNLMNKFDQYGDLLAFEISPMLSASNKEKSDAITKMYSVDLEHSYEERKRRNRTLGGHQKILGVFTGGAKRLRPAYSFCNAHVNTMAFDPYGNIYSCLVAVDKEKLAVGTYYPKVSFKENSMYNRNIETISECSECVYALLCGGGCAMALPPGDGICRPACAATHEEIHTLLPRFFQMEQEKKAAKTKAYS